MSVNHVNDVEFGAELPTFEPDTRLETGARFAHLIGWGGPGLPITKAPKRKAFQAR